MGKFRETQGTYSFHIYEFQHMVMFKIMGKTLQNPFCLNQASEIFLKEIFSRNSRKIPAIHKCHMWWSCKVSSQSQLIWFTKIFQNHSCPESSLNNFTLWSLSYWPQTLWACSNHLLMLLHQVVDLEEVKCMLGSIEIWFCQILGFSKFPLSTLLK